MIEALSAFSISGQADMQPLSKLCAEHRSHRVLPICISALFLSQTAAKALLPMRNSIYRTIYGLVIGKGDHDFDDNIQPQVLIFLLLLAHQMR